MNKNMTTYAKIQMRKDGLVMMNHGQPTTNELSFNCDCEVFAERMEKIIALGVFASKIAETLKGQIRWGENRRGVVCYISEKQAYWIARAEVENNL